MKNIHKQYHTIEDVFYTENKVILECLTSIEKFNNIKGFWSSIFGDLNFIEIHREDRLVKYRVELYRKKNSIGERREEFYVVLKNGRKERVWKPSSSLELSSLPSGYGFTSIYINLTYQKNLLPRHKFFTVILDTLEYTSAFMKLRGYLFIPKHSDYDLSKFVMKFSKFRQESIMIEFPICLTLPREKEIFGFLSADIFSKFTETEVFLFDIEIPLVDISIYSGIFNILIANTTQVRRIQNFHTALSREEKISTYLIDDTNIALFNFYYDTTVKVWRFEIYRMSQKENLLLGYLENQERDDFIWLVGEYTISASDNGMHFYHYVLENHPQIDIYYVIDKSSKDYKNLNKSKVLDYGSYQHFKIAAKAKVLVFSHMPNYLIPKINSITKYKDKYQTYLRVFLQHGVIAKKNVNVMQKKNFEYDIFNVSSQLEQSIVNKNLHYEMDDILINGLPRWDRIFNEKRKSNTILIMPTFRDDLEQSTSEVFKSSNYFKFWNGLLSNQKFIDYIEENNIIVFFFIHIVLVRFIDTFSINSKRILFKNSDKLQELLLDCGMLVTDYSSVSFDVLFQNKPVIYVPFDYSHIVKIRGGENYIDYEKDLPGDICYSVEELIVAIINRVNSGWNIAEKYQDRRLKFFKNIDNKNSERVYKSIVSHKKINCAFESYVIKTFTLVGNKSLEFEVLGYCNEVIEEGAVSLVLKTRKVPLEKDIVVHEYFSFSFKQLNNGFIIVKFIVPLEDLMRENETLIYTFDFFLNVINRDFRLEYSKNLRDVFTVLNYDFIPYVTRYNAYSLIMVRKKSLTKLSKIESITLVLFRVDLKDNNTKKTIDLANLLTNYGYKVNLVSIDILSLSNAFPISTKINFDFISNYLHRKKDILPLDIYNSEVKIHLSFIKIVKEYFSKIDTNFIYLDILNSDLVLSILESIPLNVQNLTHESIALLFKTKE